MSGIDRQQAIEQLTAEGWIEDQSAGRDMLRPPAELLRRICSMSFYVYDAVYLQSMVEDEEEMK